MATTHLVVAALVRREGRLLLVEEMGPDDPGPTWMLPGGIVEAGESVVEGLRRELREETGLELAGEPRLAFVVHVVEPEDTHLALTFSCEGTGTLAPNDPDGLVLDIAWVDETGALARLDQVSWYDTGPLRRHMARDPEACEVAVVDRR